MQKFRCEKCGHRIAIQPRHLGTLVTCPDCGNLTHPLAEKIIERSPAGIAPAATGRTPHAEPSRSCENCGRAIGRLEMPQLWERSIVCSACHRALSETSHPQLLMPERPAPSLPTIRTTSKAAIVSTRARRRDVAARAQPAPRATVPRFTFRVPRGPLRIILWLIAIALGAWFVLNVVQFVNVLVNVAIVGFLLLAALWVLYQSGMHDLAQRAEQDRQDSDAAD